MKIYFFGGFGKKDTPRSFYHIPKSQKRKTCIKKGNNHYKDVFACSPSDCMALVREMLVIKD